jgi:hypothetical protein
MIIAGRSRPSTQGWNNEDAWTALEWFERLRPGEDHGRLPPHVSLWWQFLSENGLIESGVGLAMFRLSSKGRLALHLHRQATLTANSPMQLRPAKAMPSAARESVGSEELPKPQAYPVHVESLSDEVAQPLGRNTDNPVSLDDEDAAILGVWEAWPFYRLNLDQIASFTERPRVSRRVVVERMPALEREGLITRPLGPKQRYFRTEKGREALAQYNASRSGT